MSTTIQLDNAPLSEFQPCRCPGVLPGRACPACFSTKWLKRCPHCFGSGIIFKNARGGEPRSEPCINCKQGWQAAMPADLRRMAELDAAAGATPTPAESVPEQMAAAQKKITSQQGKHRHTPRAAVMKPGPAEPDLAPQQSQQPGQPAAGDNSYQDMN